MNECGRIIDICNKHPQIWLFLWLAYHSIIFSGCSPLLFASESFKELAGSIRQGQGNKVLVVWSGWRWMRPCPFCRKLRFGCGLAGLLRLGVERENACRSCGCVMSGQNKNTYVCADYLTASCRCCRTRITIVTVEVVLLLHCGGTFWPALTKNRKTTNDFFCLHT